MKLTFLHFWVRALPCLCGLLALPLSAEQLFLYSGRSKALVEPIIQAFERETGIRVHARFGGTSQLAIALQEEGRRSRADLFWAQDAGVLGSVRTLFASLPVELTGDLVADAVHTERRWVGTSGRARVFVYAPGRVASGDLPEALEDLADSVWQERVGWAPANSSFQTFVTALRHLEGERATKAWLASMRANGAQTYPNNSALLQAVAAGEIDLALTNHYYLYRALERNPDFPVAQAFFAEGSPGNLVNYAAVGVLETSRNRAAAERFVAFLLSPKAQGYFVENVFEYPVRDVVEHLPSAIDQTEIQRVRPQVDSNALDDLSGTISLLREVGLL